MLELRQLTYFVAVAEALHFARAAERLHIAQPALSMQIKALEEKLGVRLLARSKRSVSLTDAGALFLAEARLTLDRARTAEEIGRRAARAAVGRVQVGYDSSIAFTRVLSAVLRNFGSEHAGVELVFSEHPSALHADALAAGEVDFSVYRMEYADTRPGLLSMPLLREPFDVVLPSAHRFAGRDVLSLGDLAEEKLIACHGGRPAGAPLPIAELWRRHGWTAHVERSVAQPTAIVSLVAAGLGVGIVPHSLSQLSVTDAIFRPLAVEAASTVAFACRRNEQAPAILALIKAARRFAVTARTASCGDHPDAGAKRRFRDPRPCVEKGLAAVEPDAPHDDETAGVTSP